MIKKFFIAGLICSIMTGCQSSVNEEDIQTSQLPTKQVLRIVSNDSVHVNMLEKIKPMYENEHPNVSIELIHIDDLSFFRKSTLEPNNFDVITLDDPLIPEYIEAKVLTNLTSLGYQDDSDFVTASQALGKNPYGQGDTYALPFSGNIQLLLYNKSLLASIGANVPETWEQVIDIADKLKQQGYTGFAIRGRKSKDLVTDFLPILWAYGGDIFNDKQEVVINSKEAVDALKICKKLQSDKMQITKSEIISLLTGNKMGMTVGWPAWISVDSTKEIDYGEIPPKTNDTAEYFPTGMIGNGLIGIVNTSQNKDIALDFIQYATSYEVQKQLVPKGAIPTRASVFIDGEILAKYPYLDIIFTATINSVMRPRTSKWADIESVLSNEIYNALVGNKTEEQALNDSKKAIENIIK